VELSLTSKRKKRKIKKRKIKKRKIKKRKIKKRKIKKRKKDIHGSANGVLTTIPLTVEVHQIAEIAGNQRLGGFTGSVQTANAIPFLDMMSVTIQNVGKT
jgi:hypothetical protein